MMEANDLIVLVHSAPDHPATRNLPIPYFVPVFDLVNNAQAGQALEYGEWTVSIHLEGDNFAGDYRFKFSLRPKGGLGIAPIQ